MTLYRWLLHLYPARFREEYARQMEIQFRDEYREASGFFGKTAFWLQALGDIAFSIPGELAREGSQDLRHALRMHAKRKLVTASAVVALAMAIGATTGIFSVVNGLLLRELPFREPDRLVNVRGGKLGSLGNKAKFEEHRAEAREYLEDGAMYTSNVLNVTHKGVPRRLRVAETSANFFSLMGVHPALGRSFLNDEDDPARSAVAVISHRLWQQDLGATPDLLGSAIIVNGTTFTIVGVAPALFDFPDKSDLWTPTGFDIERIPKGAFFTQALGRLKPDLTFEQANDRFKTIVRRTTPDEFQLPPGIDPENLPHLTRLHDQLVRPIRGATVVLFGTAAFVLLIACANVAQLLLARLNERRQEMAVRAALGATRARLLQQLIVEAMALTGTAAIAGMAMAYWTAQLMGAFAPAGLNAQSYEVLDARVIGFSVGLAILSGVLFGIVPAYSLGRNNGTNVGRLRTSLVALQTAVTLVLLAGAFTLGRAFLNIMNTDLGLRTSNVIALTATLDGTASGKNPGQYFERVIETLRVIPGVEDAGVMLNLPLQDYAIVSASMITLDSNGAKPVRAIFNATGRGAFSTLQQPFAAGRDFTTEERNGTVPALIVNEDFARASGLGAGIVGHRTQGKNAEVVGVVRSVRTHGPFSPSSPMVYGPFRGASGASVAVRVRGDAIPYIALLREAAQSVDRAVPIHDVHLMDELLGQQVARPRFYTAALTGLGAFALFCLR